nr:T-cell receptor-associated transmembrane adapter 1 [Kogia breviceps]
MEGSQSSLLEGKRPHRRESMSPSQQPGPAARHQYRYQGPSRPVSSPAECGKISETSCKITSAAASTAAVYKKRKRELGRENSECQFYVWAILAFLGLALTISLIFNISHYVEKQRQDKIYKYSDDYFPRENEYDLEDTPIYGNLDNAVPEPVDENYYEQMKAGPERSVNKLQEDAPPSQETEAKMFYASLDHSCEGKRRKPKKQKTYLSDKDEDGKVHAMDINLSKTTLADSFPPESLAIEENIHDDPIRLFGLIRAQKL